MVKRNIVVKEIIMHQHIDKLGRICGAKHPIDAEHKNKKTQKKHDFTMKK